MSNRALPIAIIVIIVIGAVVGYVMFMSPTQPDVPDGEDQTNGETEIVFTLTSGDEVTVDDLLADDKPLIIYFFATWCPVCRQDLINLNATHPEYADEINVLVVGFDRTESLDRIRDYKEARNYEWPFAGYNSEAITEFQIVSQSSKVGITMDGEVVFTEGYGVLSTDGWGDLFRELT